jgi:hypothetical protein
LLHYGAMVGIMPQVINTLIWVHQKKWKKYNQRLLFDHFHVILFYKHCFRYLISIDLFWSEIRNSFKINQLIREKNNIILTRQSLLLSWFLLVLVFALVCPLKLIERRSRQYFYINRDKKEQYVYTCLCNPHFSRCQHSIKWHQRGDTRVSHR